MLDLAIELALKLPKRQYRYVSIITDKKDKILSIGVNSYSKTHPLQAKYAKKLNLKNKIYLHSEIYAIVKCRRNITPCKIYIARVDSLGEVKLVKPCPICSQAISDIGISEVYYTEEKKDLS